MKILFLEDRPGRQKLFLPNKEKDVEKMQSLSGLVMPEGCKEILAWINQGKYDFPKGLKLIIIHKSALETKGLIYLNDICKEEKIKLVCFSGGISQLVFNNEGVEMLNINSSDFYSERLIPFLERVTNEQPFHLLELANEQWELSYLCLARQIIGSLNIETDEDSKELLKEKLDRIEKILNFPLSENELNNRITRKILQL